MTNRVRRRVVVHGTVQGVFFRSSTRDEALSRGVSGWVRNRRDGAVEAVFEGEPRAVDECVAFCHSGPPGARVVRVEVFDDLPPEGARGFSVTR